MKITDEMMLYIYSCKWCLVLSCCKRCKWNNSIESGITIIQKKMMTWVSVAEHKIILLTE